MDTNLISFKAFLILLLCGCSSLSAENEKYISAKVKDRMVSLSFEFSRYFLDAISSVEAGEQIQPTLADIGEEYIFVYVSNKEGKLLKVITIRSSEKKVGFFVGELDGLSRKAVPKKSRFVDDLKLALIIKRLKKELETTKAE